MRDGTQGQRVPVVADEEAIDRDGLARRAHLKPPRNYRPVNDAHSCANCALLTTESVDGRGDVTYCTRPGGPEYETGLQEEWFNICDNWKKWRIT